jgi:hypothetical protein
MWRNFPQFRVLTVCVEKYCMASIAVANKKVEVGEILSVLPTSGSTVKYVNRALF